MPHKSPSQETLNERRNYFRIEDTVMMRFQPVDQNSALAHHLPPQLKDAPGYSLIRELQQIDQENHKFLRVISENNRDLESYLKGLNKKIDLIAAKLIEYEEPAPDQREYKISLSEGGLSFCTQKEYAHGSYLAMQLTLLPSYLPITLFARVINCSAKKTEYRTAVSFVNLKDTDRQLIAKHIMQLQLAQRRQIIDEQ